MGFRVWGLGLGVSGLGLRVSGLGVQGVGFRVLPVLNRDDNRGTTIPIQDC